MMASEILMLIGSMVSSTLNGPIRRSVRPSRDSVNKRVELLHYLTQKFVKRVSLIRTVFS